MENEEQVTEATNSEVELNIEETPEEKPDELEKEREARRQLTARAKKAEQELAQLKSKAPVGDDLKSDIEALKLAEKKRQFGYRNQLSPEETDKLFRYAGDSDPEEVLKDEFFQAGLAESRRKQKVEDATPSGSNRAFKVDGKTFSEMTSEERAKNWSKMTGK